MRNLPPGLADHLRRTHSVAAKHVEELGLARATDEAIFARACEARCVVVTKDFDFVRLLSKRGPPPQVLWLTVGNLTNAELRTVIDRNWARIRTLFETGEALVEICRAGP